MNKRNFIKKTGIAGLAGVSALLVPKSDALAGTDLKKGDKKPLLVHQVYFWLKKDLSPAQVNTFEKGLNSLLKITTMVYGSVGKPAATADRSVVDRSYSYALLTIFNDVAGHDAYQIDPIHEQFLKDCKEMWEKVVVYDAATN